ncbi:MAG: hypothetical protein VKK04_04745 [Synechococcales bacterium]|nr:hypothetical protein [Synechococcales bacterium]
MAKMWGDRQDANQVQQAHQAVMEGERGDRSSSFTKINKGLNILIRG